MHIAVAGNIGSGKTTLTSLLAKHYKWHAHYEDADDNPYLNDFYEDMQRWSFNLQIYFLNNRFNQILDIRKGKHTVIQDRTIYEDAYIFAPNLHAMGLMNLGLIGLVIVMAQFIFTLRGILRENAEKKLMLLCLLIPLLINSFTEFGIFGESNYGILFYQLILMYISFKSNTIFSIQQKLHLLKTKRISDDF